MKANLFGPRLAFIENQEVKKSHKSPRPIYSGIYKNLKDALCGRPYIMPSNKVSFVATPAYQK